MQAQADPEASFRSSMEVAEHPSCVSPGSPPSQQFQMRSTRNPVGEKLPVVKDASGRALPPVDPSEDACKPPAGNQAGGREPGTGEKNGALGIHPSESQKSGLLAGAATVEERATCGAVGASDHKQEKAAEVGTRGSRVGGSVAESEAKLDGLKKKLDSQERLDTSNLPPKGTPIDPWQREGGVKAKVLSIEGGAVDGSSPGSVPCEANESILREQDARHPKEGPAAGSLQVAQAGLLPLAERYGSLWTAYAQELPKQASEDGGPSGQRPWDGAGIASPRYAEPRGRLSDSAPRDSGADREFLAALLGALSVLIRAAGAVDEAIGADSETPLQCLERLQRMEMDRGRQKPEERKAAAD